ncbi:MAG TPA: ribokinase [Gemmataceae bacterium]|jgi:ribokinase|nr:ribokinase [Gemmataceae bacterium]
MPNERPRICVVGSSNIDLIFRTARLPREGETIAGKTFQLSHGGKGGNQAVSAARLGAHVTILTKVGRDVFGDAIARDYREQTIDTTHLLVDEQRFTGVASIAVDDEARNCIIVVPGANHGLSPQDVRQAAAAIRAADLLLCQLEVPVETTLEAFRVAKTATVRTVLNPAPAAVLPDELLRLTDLCVPNETEVESLTGLPAGTLAEAEAAARRLLQRGPHTVIVTLGARGTLAVDARAAEHVPPFAVDAVDPTGAGDAFIGGLAVSLAEGCALSEAVRRANAVAAISVTRLGTQVAYPTRPELEGFLRR